MDGYESGRRQEEEEEGKKRDCGSSSREERMLRYLRYLLEYSLNWMFPRLPSKVKDGVDRPRKTGS